MEEFESMKKRLEGVFRSGSVVMKPEIKDILFVVDEQVFDCDLLLPVLKQLQARTRARMVFLPLPLNPATTEVRPHESWGDIIVSLRAALGLNLVDIVFASGLSLFEQIKPVLTNERYQLIVILSHSDLELSGLEISLTNALFQVIEGRKTQVPVLLIRPDACGSLFASNIALYLRDPGFPGQVIGSIVLISSEDASIVVSLPTEASPRDRERTEALVEAIKAWAKEERIHLQISLRSSGQSLSQFSAGARQENSDLLVFQADEKNLKRDLLSLLSDWRMVLLVPAKLS